MKRFESKDELLDYIDKIALSTIESYKSDYIIDRPVIKKRIAAKKSFVFLPRTCGCYTVWPDGEKANVKNTIFEYYDNYERTGTEFYLVDGKNLTIIKDINKCRDYMLSEPEISVIDDFEEINYRLIRRNDSTYQPFVVAYNFDHDDTTWAQGHYFSDEANARDYISSILVEADCKNDAYDVKRCDKDGTIIEFKKHLTFNDAHSIYIHDRQHCEDIETFVYLGGRAVNW